MRTAPEPRPCREWAWPEPACLSRQPGQRMRGPLVPPAGDLPRALWRRLVFWAGPQIEVGTRALTEVTCRFRASAKSN